MEFDKNNQAHISKKWRQYIDTVKRVNPFLEKAFEIVEKENIEIKTAYDIGCGPGNESNYIIEKGIQLNAFDYNKECLDLIEERFPNLKTSTKFKFVHTKIENIDWQPVDLIVSIKVLSFLKKDDFFKTLEKLKNAVNNKGVVVLNFFGEEDDWQELSLVTKDKIEEIFKEFNFLHFEETVSKQSIVSGGFKKGHIIELIAQKK